MALSAAEQAVLNALRLDEPWSLVETFSRLPRWRPADVNKGADVIVATAKKLGLPVEVHEPEIYLSVPHEASVTIGGRTFRAKPPALSHAAPEGRSAPVLYLRSDAKNLRSYSRDLKDVFGDSFTTHDDFRARIAGKIVLTEGFGNPALTSLVAELGAAGLVVINPGANIHWGTSGTVWGSPGLGDLAKLPAIPVAAVSKPDGEAIKALAVNGGEITVRTRLETGWFRQKVPVVTIPAEGAEADQFVLVHGHYDSWDVGVGDNATGNACLLALADALWRSKQALRRSVRVAWWPGHSTGRYAGSTWYADAFARDLDRNCVAQVNCDSPGCRWATSYHQTTCMSELHGFITGVIRDVTGKSPEFIRPKNAGDYSFFNIGISSYFMLSSTMPEELRREKNYYDVSGCGGNIAWHTEDDTMEIADKAILMTDARIYTLSVLRHATAPLLPTDWSATVTELGQCVAQYQRAAAGTFDLAPCEAATKKLGDAITRFNDQAQSGRIAPQLANSVSLRLARILVPMNFTRQPRFTHDPAMNCPGIPMLLATLEIAKQGPEALPAIRAELMRGQNQYVAAIEAAEELVEAAMG